MVLYPFRSDRVAAGTSEAFAYFVGENLEKMYVELGLNGVEVWVDPRERSNKGFPAAPHAVFVGGSTSRDTRSGRCLDSAESADEIISGRG